MGLLDDAIREHLELKRRRGADPGEVARAQREALDPIVGNEQPLGEDVAVAEETTRHDDAHADGEMTLDDDEITRPNGETPATLGVDLTGDDLSVPGARLPEDADTSNVQETAELDMQKVLAQDAGRPVARERPASEEDSLEWEIPRETRPDAGADSRPADVSAVGPSDAEHMAEPEHRAARVLEESPDQPESTMGDTLSIDERRPRNRDVDR